ncbi:MAG: hypothetical protein MR006_06470 [Arcanobacterium sp.]|nr:hypothetical protein [Arcanobacterium sp.]MDY5589822.1 hypothetical protein [Arcanobacterium sp.]
MPILSRIARWWRGLVWNELALPSKGSVKRIISRRAVLAYLWLAVVALAALAMLMVMSLQGGKDAVGAVVTLLTGYNLLFVAGLTTAVTLAYLLVVSCLRVFGVLRVELQWLEALKVALAVVGAAGIGGTILGTLLVVVEPKTTSDSLVTAVTPSLLYEMPAFGAALGYPLACVAAIAVLTARLQNPVVRFIGPPAVMAFMYTLVTRLLVPTPMATVTAIVGARATPQAQAIAETQFAQNPIAAINSAPDLFMWIFARNDPAALVVSSFYYSWFPLIFFVLYLACLRFIPQARPYGVKAGKNRN